MKVIIGIFSIIAAIAWVALFMWLLDNQSEFISVLKGLAFIGHATIGYAIAIYFLRRDLWNRFINKK